MARVPPAGILVALIVVSLSVLATVPSARAAESPPRDSQAGPAPRPNAADSVIAEIAYRSTSGSTGASAPKNRSLEGSSWTAATEQATAGSSIRAVRMAWSPVTADERIFVTQSTDGGLDAFVCRPTCNVTNDIGQVWSTAPGTPERRFDLAYESVSGAALLAYGVDSTDPTQDIAYRTYAGGAWSAEQYLDDPTDSSDVEYSLVILAARGGNDQIALLGADTTNDDVNAWIWDGGAFGSFVEVNAGAENPDEYQAAIAWESGSGHLLAVSVDAGTADCTSREFTSNWTVATTVPCGSSSPVRWLSLKPNPNLTAQDMVLAVGDNGNDLNTVYWDGTAWGAPVSQDTGIDFNNARSFDFAWEASGGRGVLAWGTAPGWITFSTFLAPNTWGNATDVSMGSSTHRWVQLRTNTAPVPGGARILGAVLENGANDLGAVSWDGTNLTVAGASVVTADTGSSTYESYDLQPRVTSSGFTFNLFGGGTINLFGFQIGLTTLLALVAGVAALIVLLAWRRRSRHGRAPSQRKSRSSRRSSRRSGAGSPPPAIDLGEPVDPFGSATAPEPEPSTASGADFGSGSLDAQAAEPANEPAVDPWQEPATQIENDIQATPAPKRRRKRS